MPPSDANIEVRALLRFPASSRVWAQIVGPGHGSLPAARRPKRLSPTHTAFGICPRVRLLVSATKRGGRGVSHSRHRLRAGKR